MHTCTTTVSPICTANGMRCTTHASAWERGGKAKKNKTVGDDMTSIQRQVIPQCTHTRAHTHTHTHKTHTHTHTHTQDTHKTHTRHTHTHKTHTGIQTYLVNIGGNGNNGDDENANASKEKVAPEQKDKVRRLSNRLWSSWVPHCFCRPHTACSTHLYRRACALYNSGASTSGAPSLLLSPCPASMVYEPRAMSLPLLPANKGKGEAGGFVLKC